MYKSGRVVVVGFLKPIIIVIIYVMTPMIIMGARDLTSPHVPFIEKSNHRARKKYRITCHPHVIILLLCTHVNVLNQYLIIDITCKLTVIHIRRVKDGSC